MGAKSTLDIGRTFALDFVMRHLSSVDNGSLAYIVELINDDLYDKRNWDETLGLHNFIINESE